MPKYSVFKNKLTEICEVGGLHMGSEIGRQARTQVDCRRPDKFAKTGKVCSSTNLGGNLVNANQDLHVYSGTPSLTWAQSRRRVPLSLKKQALESEHVAHSQLSCVELVGVAVHINHNAAGIGRCCGLSRLYCECRDQVVSSEGDGVGRKGAFAADGGDCAVDGLGHECDRGCWNVGGSAHGCNSVGADGDILAGKNAGSIKHGRERKTLQVRELARDLVNSVAEAEVEPAAQGIPRGPLPVVLDLRTTRSKDRGCTAIYSALRASMGSVVAARSAGIIAARMVTTTRVPVTPTSVEGS